ncbi:acyl-CoA carboxylase subunit epsilon [Nesterenkonia natronophila]|uniref:Acyl-CoA carboxylase subunit epsilon n=1 Tax=Nesterenkonia natronophila TaxID=2174932 RepID=A0A3A4G159_9MICC|nr:acyl-CoA carboxylase subunit epsilon [Nesterenkonia natronophila]RJN31749.1 acyl-CoA carboxylase subunit epsilon [Nesterenkonia natronophila]
MTLDREMITPPPEVGSASPPDRAPGSEERTLPLQGVELTEEELAAVVAVLATLASSPSDATDAGGTGPADRALQRKHRLAQDQHGLWGRPGPASWNQATGGGLR